MLSVITDGILVGFGLKSKSIDNLDIISNNDTFDHH